MVNIFQLTIFTNSTCRLQYTTEDESNLRSSQDLNLVFWVARTCRCFYQPSHWSSGISRSKGWKVVLPIHRQSLILRLIFDLSWVLQYPWSHTKVHCAYCTSINTTAATLYYHQNLQPEMSLLLHTECLCFRSQDGRRLFVGERIFRLCWCSK